MDRGIVEARSIPRLTLGTDRSAGGTLALWQGDITTLRIDAIVNAANAAMLGCFRPMHACIDNAIHSGAGPRLREDCARIMAIQGHEEPTGAAKVTRGFNLPARYVLHTVGPIVNGPLNGEHDSLLTSCYHACLDLAAELGDARSVAFCSISTGVFGYPKAPAATTAIEAVSEWLLKHPDTLDLVVFNVFSDEDRLVYERALGIASTGSSNR